MAKEGGAIPPGTAKARPHTPNSARRSQLHKPYPTHMSLPKHDRHGVSFDFLGPSTASPQISNMMFTFDGNQPTGSRVLHESVSVAGKPLDLEREYVVACLDIAASGKVRCQDAVGAYTVVRLRLRMEAKTQHRPWKRPPCLSTLEMQVIL